MVGSSANTAKRVERRSGVVNTLRMLRTVVFICLLLVGISGFGQGLSFSDWRSLTDDQRLAWTNGFLTGVLFQAGLEGVVRHEEPRPFFGTSITVSDLKIAIDRGVELSDDPGEQVLLFVFNRIALPAAEAAKAEREQS